MNNLSVNSYGSPEYNPKIQNIFVTPRQSRIYRPIYTNYTPIPMSDLSMMSTGYGPIPRTPPLRMSDLSIMSTPRKYNKKSI